MKSAKLESMSKDELIELVRKLRKRKKYGLVWEDKLEDVVSQCQHELPVLEEVADRVIHSVDDQPTNLIIEGDNYHALSVLNYTHKGKIDVIYIDPPYNTGAKDWKYNNDYVDGEDPYRHTKWLSMMANRLRACKDLLVEDGIICITIDDYEMPRLWLLAESIFGEDNHLGSLVIRNNPKGRMTNKKLSLVHEYAIFFGKSANAHIKKLPVSPEDKSHNYLKDKDGTYYLPINLRKQGVDSNAITRRGVQSERYYTIYFDPDSGAVSTNKKYSIEILPIDQSGQKRIWRRSKDVIDAMYKSGDLWVKEVKKKHQVYFKFRGGLAGEMPKSIWYEPEYSASEYGTSLLDKMLGSRELFQYPKSPHAVTKTIRSASNNKNAIILDFFAGSGTTGHAVIQLNKDDGGKRQFILCTNNENKIAEEVTYPRIQKVIDGYADVEGIPANVRYFRTAFVPRSDVSDDTRYALVERSADMICVREGTYEKVNDTKQYKIFTDGHRTTGILYDLEVITAFKKALTKHGLPASLYIFTLSADAYEDEFRDLKIKHKLCPIPESILEVYRKLFRPVDEMV